MRKLIVLVALSLGASTAWAQAPAANAVTKLPGEEKLSMRERAERDFLMPVRRKRAAELAKQPTAFTEQLATAAPENDALSTYNEAAPDPRPEEAAVAHEAHATRSRAARHAAWLAARRERLAEARAAERRAAHRSSRKSSVKTKHTSKASKAKTHASKAAKSKTRHRSEEHHSSRKATTKKATAHKSAHKATATKSKHHTAAAKTKTKTKPAKHKRR
ncbi:hypothetical protein HHL22_13425 [Hymenobacter sp. RP-2-7]|uniref:Uncharacterized protein n=1 Tax=Hymenobacter polaris TaxID=2682546 RepID=A0A7Y0FMS4_9BACT|nr:hypothetical protein [Hymenobacter polaris]NML66208.1 hypothetical protein [Hymenobacter polaris]